MNKAIWAVAGVALLGTASAAAVFVASSGGEEEVVQQPATATVTPASATPTAAASAAPSPAASSTPAATAEASPGAVPADWQTYDDPVRTFSLRYPPGLVFQDLTQPSPVDGVNERVVQFRSATDQARSFSISVSSNTHGLSTEAWALEFAACNPKSIKSATLGGIEAIACDREVLGPPEPSVLAERLGRIFLITTGPGLTESEFASVVQSFQF